VSPAAEALFVVSAVIAIGGAVGTVVARNPLRAAVALLVNISALAGIFLVATAPLLAVIQLLVYAGAVVVLFIFVIMLLGPAATAESSMRGMTAKTVSLALMAMIGIAITFGIAGFEPGVVPVAPAGFGSVEGLGTAIYREALLPFELVSITLLVAIVGAVAVARGRTAKELAEHRSKRAARQAGEAEQNERARKLSAEVAAHEHGLRDAAE
jgi:NADH-quinone oxidoreductase subunit J